MKSLFKICITAILALVVVTTATAQTQKPQNKKTTETEFYADFAPSDVKKIKSHFENLKGVDDVDIDIKDKTVEIEYDKTRISESDLLKNFEKLRIKARVIKKR